MLTNNEKKLLAVAQRQLESGGYTKEQMYADLSEIAGRTITTRTDAHLTHEHFKKMLKYLKRLGFKHITNRPEPPDYDHSDLTLRPPDFASKEQVDKIAEMWRFVNHTSPWVESLNRFLQSRFHLNDYRWMKKHDAEKVIEALKKMYLRKILKTTFQELFEDAPVVENRLLELYILIKTGFTREEMAAFLAAWIMGEPEIQEKIKATSNIFRKSNFTKLIGG